MEVRTKVYVAAAGFLGVLLTTAAAFPAHAKPLQPVVVVARRPDPDALTAKVSFFIADLRSDRGQKDLIRRVHFATEEVCPNVQISPLDTYQADCIKVAWGGAQPQIEAAIDSAMNSKVASAVPMTVTIGIIGAH